MGEKGVKQVVHKVEVGRTPVERELQQEIDSRDRTIRALQEQLQDAEDREVARAVAAAEALKARARAAGIDEATLDGIDSSADLKTLESWVASRERDGNIQIQDPVIERGTKPTDPPRGSQVQLNPPRVNPTGEYESYSDMIDDLYRRAENGEKLAKTQLDKLWGKLDKDFTNILKSEARLPTVNVAQCRVCGEGPVVNGICTKCGSAQNE